MKHLLVAVSVTALAITGCSGSSSPKAKVSPTVVHTSAGAAQQQHAGPPPMSVEKMKKYISCMRANGVPDFPEPNANGIITGVNIKSAGYKTASKACNKLLPPGANPPPPPQ
jgi:hypothetical protein